MHLRSVPLLALLISVSAGAAELNVSVEIPQLQVAEYHRPYTALWIEQDGKMISTLAVWYETGKRAGKSKGGEGKGEDRGEEWLKDMRQWWRRGGRSLDLPIDGVSGATRVPGHHALTFSDGEAPLGQLAAGNYELMVEAAREVGGREVVSVPFQWPPVSTQKNTVKGERELGEITLSVAP